ncbi:MAG: polysaccharide deacetylase family protein [Bacteroidales bacterium]
MKRILGFTILILTVLSGCGRQPDPPEDGKVIILLYHRLTAGEATTLYERSVADFEADLVWMNRNNIRIIDFPELEKIVAGEKKLTTDAAIITFDDGDHSWYTLTMPVLKKFGKKATFFLWTSKMGMNSFLTWEEVEMMSRYMDENGETPFEFGSHTASHQYMLDRKAALGAGAAFDAYLDEELGGSKRLIDSHIRGSVQVLSLPFGNGAGDMDIISGAQRNGYSIIRTSEWSAISTSGADLYRLPCLPILNNTNRDLIGDYLGR